MGAVIMAKGISIHLGLNAVDPVHYQGWSGDLNACEFDANDMAQIATMRGFTPNLILTKKCTISAFETAAAKAAASLQAGDICFISYSGHGGTLPDKNGDEDDGQDETWCLYDGQIVDDQIFAILAKFKPGVRVIVLSDSCHSGTMTKNALLDNCASNSGAAAPKFRAMPMNVSSRTYLHNRAFYDKILDDKQLPKAQASVEASCILISGCQDNQLSGDGAFNGVFTGRLKIVWNGGMFSGNYKKFWKVIRSGMPPDQTPNLFMVGKKTAAFLTQNPFKI
jgi:metacaspase-1